MIDKEKLKKAQEWADLASEMAKYDPTLPERAKAAAEVIKSLPDEWIDADNLREALQELDSAVTSGHGNQWDSGYNLSTREWAQRLKKLLPAPPAPRTMDEIEWDDAEHHLAEATAAWAEGTTSEVVMLHRHGDTIAVHQSAPHYTGLRQLNPAILTPTGRKHRLEPEDDVASATGGELTTQDVVDECRAVRKERAAPESAAPRPERVPEFDPAYTYRDGDGDEWECLDGQWITDDTHAERVARREITPGRAIPPAEYGPYTRIEDNNE